jgi:hypothetical protein
VTLGFRAHKVFGGVVVLSAERMTLTGTLVKTKNIIGTLVKETPITATLEKLTTRIVILGYTRVIENPTDSEFQVFFKSRTTLQMTIDQISGVLQGSSSPSIDFNISFGPDISGSLTDVFATDQTIDSTTTGNDFTSGSMAETTIPAGSWVIVTTSAKTGVVDELSLTLFPGIIKP